MIETFTKVGGYILGFRIDPQEKMSHYYDEISKIYSICFQSPIFGVDHAIENLSTHDKKPSEMLPTNPTAIEEGNVENLVEDVQEDTHAVAAFYMGSVATADNEYRLGGDEGLYAHISFDPKLGLAMEELQGGLTLEQLWRVV